MWWARRSQASYPVPVTGLVYTPINLIIYSFICFGRVGDFVRHVNPVLVQKSKPFIFCNRTVLQTLNIWYIDLWYCNFTTINSVLICVIFIIPLKKWDKLWCSGPGCSKLTTSLINISLKFQTLISNICQYFFLKKCEKLLHFLIFSTKNSSVFGYKVVNT